MESLVGEAEPAKVPLEVSGHVARVERRALVGRKDEPGKWHDRLSSAMGDQRGEYPAWQAQGAACPLRLGLRQGPRAALECVAHGELSPFEVNVLPTQAE